MNGPSNGAAADSPSASNKILFWASFCTLIAAGIGFSVRGVDLLTDWGTNYHFTQAELGTISGGGLVGFGLAIIFFSFFADRFGYGKLMLIAFLLHTSSAIVTCLAEPVNRGLLSSIGISGKPGIFWCLNAGMWLFALGNGTCEAVINPLTATLFKNNKTHWLNILHAGWPLGLILGAAIMLGFKYFGPARFWEYKLAVFLIPVLFYGFLMFNRKFPKSEAQSASIPVSGMMKEVGMLGFTLGAAIIGLALANLLPSVLGPFLKGIVSEDILRYVGWGAAIAVWLAFGVVTKFAPGHWIIAFLYLMHALVGYVELGTDSWITNITNQVVNSPNYAIGAFIWVNALMFTLRFFAGPIVHKINPVGLLCVSACLGTVGLSMLGMSFTNSIWPWIGAATVYALGKTFYWPTLLGVISERFPKGGALALGLSGGIGMIGAGILGAPGIGYKQDYFAVEKLQQTADGKAAYERYMARNDKNEPETTGFPIVTSIFPNQVPPIAGIDNAKLKVFEDYGANLAKVEQDKAARIVSPGMEGLNAYMAEVDRAAKAKEEPPKILLTTMESDLVILLRQKKEDKPVEAKLEQNLTSQKEWWDKNGRPNYSADKDPLQTAKLYGAKTALLYTAAVPATLAVGFFFLLLVFMMQGGYKQVHIHEEPTGPTEY